WVSLPQSRSDTGGKTRRQVAVGRALLDRDAPLYTLGRLTNRATPALFPIGSHLPYDRRMSKAAERVQSGGPKGERNGRHDRPCARRPGGCCCRVGGTAPRAFVLRAEPEVRSGQDGRGQRQRNRV